jgi:hypothetical protein
LLTAQELYCRNYEVNHETEPAERFCLMTQNALTCTPSGCNCGPIRKTSSLLETKSTLQENLCDSIHVFVFQIIPEGTSIGVRVAPLAAIKPLASGTDFISPKGLYSGLSPIHLIVYSWNLRIGK